MSTAREFTHRVRKQVTHDAWHLMFPLGVRIWHNPDEIQKPVLSPPRQKRAGLARAQNAFPLMGNHGSGGTPLRRLARRHAAAQPDGGHDARLNEHLIVTKTRGPALKVRAMPCPGDEIAAILFRVARNIKTARRHYPP